MKRVARLNPPEYIIGLGDNFYFHGVEDDEDEMWEKTFEQVRIFYNLYSRVYMYNLYM